MKSNPTPENIEIITLSNSQGMSARITNFGGIVLSLTVIDKFDHFDDVILGYEHFTDYQNDTYYMGAIVGRYANRIAKGSFKLNNTTYQLNTNDGSNHLHGGNNGFWCAIWQITNVTENSLQLKYTSADGEENYPGKLQVQVTYTITEANELKIYYSATSDQDTIINLTNHSYFNLAGHGNGDILDHQLKINAEFFTPIDQETIPTGEILKVANTPFDFRKLTTIRSNLDETNQQVKYGNGFDHNWVINERNGLKHAAQVYEPTCGRIMDVFTTKPGIQFYSGNFLVGPIAAKNGASYDQHSGLCLETQFFPCSPNYSHFPNPILKANQEYSHTTIYRFDVTKEA